MALGDVIARLAASLTLDTVAFEKGATLAEKRMSKMTRNFEQFGKKVSGIGKALSVGLTAPLVAFGVTAVKAAQESAEAMGQVEAALKSMGDGAGRTSEQLQALASGQMRKSLYDDDEILRKVTANLLTFGNIAGAEFDRAQQAALDLSARMGTDLQSSAIMLGKALNDPAKGLAALRRVGIQFTEQQQEQIKKMAEAGDAAGAQAVMLAELERQFAGSAQAMRDADPMAAAKMSFAEFQETVGEKLLPILPVLADAIIKVLDAFSSLSPEMQQAVVIGGAVAAALGPVLTVFGGLVTVGAPLLSFLTYLAPLLGLVGKALLLIALNPAVLALAAVLGGIYLAWKNWDKIEPILKRLWEGAKKWLGEGLTAILNAIPGPVKNVAASFAWLYDVVVGNSYIPDMVDGIAAHMARLDAAMVTPAAKATAAVAKKFEDLRATLDRLFPEAGKAGAFNADLASITGSALNDNEKNEAVARLWREFTSGSPFGGGGMSGPNFGSDGGPLVEGLGATEDAIERLTEKAKIGSVRIADSFKDMADKTLASLSRLSSSIKDGGFLGILEAVIGLGMQLGSVGAFGKTIQGRLNGVPGYAGGTNFHPGGLAVVGERGPELVSMPRGSRVTPNGAMGRQTVEIVDTTGLFRFRVNGQILEAAPGIASAGAQGGVALGQYKASRRWR